MDFALRFGESGISPSYLGSFFTRRHRMNLRLGAVLLGTVFAAAWTCALAEDIKSGLEDRTGGPFDVKAITGDNKGKTLCYV